MREVDYICKVQIGSEEEHDEQTSATFSCVVMTICQYARV